MQYGGGNRGMGFGLSQEFSGYNTNMQSNTFESSQVAGGFMASQSGMGESKSVRSARVLLPVTIKQLLLANVSDMQEAKFKVDDKEFSQCKIVGQIMSIASQAATVTYVIDDGTGSIPVKNFVSNDDDSMGRRGGDLVDYAYVRVFGKLVEFQGKRSLSCHSISVITDFNELTRHRLEVIYAHLVNTKGPLHSGGSMSQPSNFSNSTFNSGGFGMGTASQASMGMGMGMGMQKNAAAGFGMGMSQGMGMGMGMMNRGPAVPNNAGMGFGGNTNNMQGQMMNVDHGLQLTPIQNMVYNVFAACKDNSRGMTLQEVCQAIPQVSPAQVQDAVAFLTNEGHVFSTIDDDHFCLCV